MKCVFVLASLLSLICKLILSQLSYLPQYLRLQKQLYLLHFSFRTLQDIFDGRHSTRIVPDINTTNIVFVIAVLEIGRTEWSRASRLVMDWTAYAKARGLVVRCTASADWECTPRRSQC